MNQTFDADALKELFELEGDTPGLVQTLVDEYVETSLKLINKIETAIQNDDFGQLELESHSLKSSSKVLGMHQLAELCFEIEDDARSKKIVPDAVKRLKALRASAVTQITSFMQRRR